MAPEAQTVSVGGHRLRLTNPGKVVYPATGATKADVIAYYVEIAPYLLPHVAGRIVTRKRWVDGVGTDSKPGSVFFEKNLPSSAPAWIRRVKIQHSDHTNTYPLFDDVAALAWAGQVGALELHVPQWRVDRDGQPQNPDRLVLDLDPGPGTGLAECVEVARLARRLLADMDLVTVPVTSGSKGLHLYAGLDGSHDADTINAFAKELARTLESELPELVVSKMSRSVRPGKVFVDWSQNNRNKTTIAPYSLRGRTEPTVAVPRTWRELGPSLEQLTMDQVLRRMKRRDDPLAPLAPARADRLDSYRSKRDARRTPEPVPADAPAPSTGRTFVIQEHHASRLHWDLRLEHDGVLVSWALPKGVPTSPSRNHLAVQTEDHPLEYATFEGTIPAGEYGAGEMTIWDSGTYELEKWRDDEVIATLKGREDGGLGAPRRYALIRTEAEKRQWLIHLTKDQTPRPPTPRGGFVEPMLARPGSAFDLEDSGDWAYEMKWDGYRLIAVVEGEAVALYSRTGKVMTQTYPTVTRELVARGLTAVLDGEVVALDENGRPDFGLLQHGRGDIRYLVFDILADADHALGNATYDERREALGRLGLDGPVVSTPSAHLGDLESALDESRERGLEGVVAKRRDSRYRRGKRSAAWIKLKHQKTLEVVVGGWRPGKGARSGGVGSLLLGVPDGDGFRYVGRVGTGFTDADLERLGTLLGPTERDTNPFDDVPADVAKEARWVEPRLVGEVEFGDWTGDGRLRHPVWHRLRDDKTVADIES